MSTEGWYDDDDRVIAPDTSCTGCGACCRHMVRPPFLHLLCDHRWVWLVFTRPDLVDAMEADRAVRSIDDAAPCLWYDADARTYRNYDLHPDVCRDFEPGTTACLEHRYVYKIGI